MLKFAIAASVLIGLAATYAFAAGDSTYKNSNNKQEVGRGRVNTDTNLTDDIRKNQGNDPNAPTVRGPAADSRANNAIQDDDEMDSKAKKHNKSSTKSKKKKTVQ